MCGGIGDCGWEAEVVVMVVVVERQSLVKTLVNGKTLNANGREWQKLLVVVVVEVSLVHAS